MEGGARVLLRQEAPVTEERGFSEVYGLGEGCAVCYHPRHCSPPGSSVHGDSPGQNTGVGCHALLQGIFPAQGSNLHLLGLLHGMQILYQ